MKILRKGMVGALCLFSFATLVGCGSNEGKSTTQAPAGDTYTVSFDTNGGSAVASQQVKKGEHATRPEDPTKANFDFAGWFKEAACENDFDFSTEAIMANTTVYANWLDSSSSDVTKAKFYWNYTGAPQEVYQEVSFKNGGRISKPADPKRDGYEFDGWYTTDNVAYSASLKYTGSQNFYAKWLKVFTMEAENTQLTGITWSIELDGVVTQSGDKKGSNFSGNVSGKNLIREDSGASNGKFVWGCMNLEEGYIDFEFTADKADANAKLNIVLSAEFWGFTLTPETFKVLVNPEDNEDDSVEFAPIDLTFVETSTSSLPHPNWVNAYINTINIKEGANLIRLLVNNDNANSVGTIKAQGPIVDCIKIKTTSELVMTTYNNQ